MFACKKFEPLRTVKVKTDSVINVSYTTCTAYGTILDKGEKGEQGQNNISFYGFCWDTVPNPLSWGYEGNRTHLTTISSTGRFVGNLTGLSSNTTYYVRVYAYVLSPTHTFFGNQLSFTTLTLSLPTLTTTTISNITENSAQSGGNITDDGGTTVTAHGICWSTTSNPTTSDSKTTDGSGIGTFTSSLTGLSSKTTYYVRAYATNSVGIAYGNEVSFNTFFGTVTDYDDNVYGTIQIGNQVWMAENLKVTHYHDGTPIQLVEDNSVWDALDYTAKAYCHYDNNFSNFDKYGALYTWATVMNGAGSSDVNPSGVQGVCPDGWHVPSDGEWEELALYISNDNGGYSQSGSVWSYVGDHLKSTTGWNSGGNGTDDYGFSALPGGERIYDGAFYGIEDHGGWWSSTEINSDRAWGTGIFVADYFFSLSSKNKGGGVSVRCVRDE